MEVLVNIGAVIPPIIMMLQGIAALIGLYLVATSLIEIWGVTHDNAIKYVAGRQRFSVGSALTSMFVGSILLAMGTLELVGILSRTLTGDYANSRVTADV
ncbi:MAG: type IV secretion protein DotIE, partial [Armatimonadota bacterium]